MVRNLIWLSRLADLYRDVDGMRFRSLFLVHHVKNEISPANGPMPAHQQLLRIFAKLHGPGWASTNYLLQRGEPGLPG